MTCGVSCVETDAETIERKSSCLLFSRCAPFQDLPNSKKLKPSGTLFARFDNRVPVSHGTANSTGAKRTLFTRTDFLEGEILGLVVELVLRVCSFPQFHRTRRTSNMSRVSRLARISIVSAITPRARLIWRRKPCERHTGARIKHRGAQPVFGGESLNRRFPFLRLFFIRWPQSLKVITENEAKLSLEKPVRDVLHENFHALTVGSNPKAQ